MENIIIEINGTRHKLVEDELTCDCADSCSLYNYCQKVIASPCKGRTHFELETKDENSKENTSFEETIRRINYNITQVQKCLDNIINICKQR